MIEWVATETRTATSRTPGDAHPNHPSRHRRLTPHRYDQETIRAALERRGLERIEQVRFRNNRRSILSVRQNGRGFRLNLHAAFREAPPALLDAVVTCVSPDTRPDERADARARIRDWPHLVHCLREARVRHERRGGGTARRRACVASDGQREHLRALFARLNEERFGGILPPDIPLRLSGRMRRRLGHCALGGGKGGSPRTVREIALAHDLMLAENDAQRVKTMLHEMAHAAAWIFDGDRGHGRAWKGWARRAGCAPRACTRNPVRRCTRSVPRVPPLQDLPSRAA